MEVVVRDIYFSCKGNARDFILQKKQVAFCGGKQNTKNFASHLPCKFHYEASINAEEQLPAVGAPSPAPLSYNNLAK